MFKRYAIYLTPSHGPFADKGADWLGWDMVQGHKATHPVFAGVDVASVTKRPRKYGFHGTIKAPFYLATGSTEQSLTEGLAALCGGKTAFSLEGLTLSKIGPFLAFTPVGDPSNLNALAADAVQALDKFRAPMDEAELARKNAPYLSKQQQAYLRRWGYPHVLEYFRFHITLTGPLHDQARSAVQLALDEHFRATIPNPFTVDGLTLCGEDKDGFFHQIQRFPLGKAANGL